VAGGGSGERWQRGCGDAPVVIRIPACLEAMECNVRPCELHKGLVKRLGRVVS
jgi:hypothetical protein